MIPKVLRYNILLALIFICSSVYSQEPVDSTKYLKDKLKSMTYEDLIDMPYEEFIKLSEVVGVSVDELMEIIMNQEVVTASKAEQLSSEAPATVFIITKDQIENRNYSYLDEVLTDVPGIEIQNKSVSEYSNYYTIRGIAGNEKFIIMQNGVKINATSGSPHVVGKNYFIENAERIEIIIGPGSALYGADAFAGIINIITNKDYDIENIKVSSEFGMFETKSVSLFSQFGNENVSFTVDGNIYNSFEPDFSDIDHYKEDFNWYNERYKTFGEMLLYNDTVQMGSIEPYKTPTKAHSLYANLRVRNFNIGYYGNSESHSSSTGMRPEYSLYSKSAIYKNNIQTVFGSHNYTSEDNKLAIESSITFSIFEISPESKFVNVFTSFEDGYKYGIDQSLRVEEQINYSFTDNQKIVGGFVAESFASQPKSGDLPFKYDKSIPHDLQGLYYIGTNITDFEGNDLTIYQDFYNISYQNYSVYLQYQQKFFNKLGLTAGCRYDYNTRYHGNFNPRVALVYNPSEKLKIAALYNEAFLAPSPYKSYEHYGSFSVDTAGNGDIIGFTSAFWNLPNDHLEPEKLRSAEINSTFFLNKNLSISLSGYYNNITNLIVDDNFMDESFQGIPVEVVKRRINKGSSETYGGNINLDWLYSYGSFFDLHYYLSYSYVDGNIDSERLYYSAKSLLKTGLSIRFNRISISPRLNYRSRSYHKLQKKDDGAEESSAPFYYINLNCNYLIVNDDKYNVTCFVKINNLLNRGYYNLSYADVEGFAQTPQDPFRLNAGLQLKIK